MSFLIKLVIFTYLETTKRGFSSTTNWSIIKSIGLTKIFVILFFMFFQGG